MFTKLITKHNKKIIYDSKNPHYETDTLFVHYFHRYWPYKKRSNFDSRMQSLIISTKFDSINDLCTHLIRTKFPDIVGKKKTAFSYHIFEMLFGPAFSDKNNSNAYLFLDHPRDAYCIISGNTDTIRHIATKYTDTSKLLHANSKAAKHIITTDQRFLLHTNPQDYRFIATVYGPNLETMRANAASDHANLVIGKKIRTINGKLCYLGTAVYDAKLGVAAN